MEMLKQQAGINLTHVPYKGGGPAAIAVMSGEVAAMFGGGSVVPLVKSGKLRALAVSGRSARRRCPTCRPSAKFYPGYEVTIWQGLFAPAGTPPAIVDRLRTEVNAVLALPEVASGSPPAARAIPISRRSPNSPPCIRSDYEKYGKVIKGQSARKVDD